MPGGTHEGFTDVLELAGDTGIYSSNKQQQWLKEGYTSYTWDIE